MQAALEDKGIKHALNLVGNQHKYQIRAAILIALQFISPSLFLAYLPFFDQSPTFLCQNSDGSFYNCYENTGGCDTLHLSPQFNSPALDFGLFCNRAYMRSWTQLCIAGIIGAALFSFISDYFGRKKAMFFSYALTAISMVLLAEATYNHIVFNALFKLVGLGIGGYISISITYLSEIGSEKFARIASGAMSVVFAAGGLIMAGLIYTEIRWRLLLLYFMGVPAVLALFSFNYLDETPTFSFRNKDIVKTIQILERMATMNNKLIDLGANIEANGIFRTDISEANRPKRYVQRWHYLQILKHPQLKYRVLIYALIRFLASLAFWASFDAILIKFTRDLSAMALLSLAAFFGAHLSSAFISLFLAYSIVNFAVYSARFGIKICLLAVFITSLCLWSVYLLGCRDLLHCQEPSFFIALLLAMQFILASLRSLLYNLGNEIFPTEVKSQCNGIGEIVAYSAGPLVPVIFKLAHEGNYSIPWLVVSVAVLIGLGLSFLIPKEDLATLEKGTEIELNLDGTPRTDNQPLL